jgi:GAF domain-containing protein
VKVRLVADALIEAPAPERGTKVWFTGPVHQPPPLAFLPCADAGRVTRDTVTAAILDTALATAHARIGNVQIADPVRGGLRIVAHTGHTEEFLQFFAHVGETGTACAVASQQADAVTIDNVETSPVFTEESREAMLAADCRGVHSIPLIGNGEVRGMVSTHYNHRAARLSPAQLRALNDLGTQAGAWLAWQQRAAVLEALENLHRWATTAA